MAEGDVGAKLSELAERCRKRGLALTIQRRIVYETLLRHSDHPTAEQLYEEVRTQLPEISRTTVYRVLETLVDLGLAGKVPWGRAVARFDPNTERHYHLQCIRCGKVQDIEPDELPLEAVTPGEIRGFLVLDYSVEVRGLCPRCRAASQ
jgi:Fur family peroxide stress response transcriptional regulator